MTSSVKHRVNDSEKSFFDHGRISKEIEKNRELFICFDQEQQQNA